MEPLLIKATWMPATRRADGSVTMKQVSMEELPTADFAHIDEYRQVNGWLMFGPNKLQLTDLPEKDAEGKYSYSQQLRFALLRLHLQRGGTEANFPAFYARSMQQFIGRVEKSGFELP